MDTKHQQRMSHLVVKGPDFSAIKIVEDYWTRRAFNIFICTLNCA